MQFQTLLFLAVAAMASTVGATPSADARCGPVNGNCYENGCGGDRSTLRCNSVCPTDLKHFTPELGYI